MSFGTRDITARLIGKDDMSPVFDKAGKSATSMGDKFKKVAKVGATALLAVGAAAIKFGADSVRAAAEAETAQNKLEDAYKRFPKLANVSIESLRKYNEQLMLKTRFDDDAFASGQAVLAQFQLTGKQIKAATPLLADWAAKTGKDIPQAADMFGKALMGNTRSLKTLGIDIELTGDKSKDFTLIQDALNKKVGGFAAKEGKTAAGMAARLRNQFGELQEKIGNKLLPVLLKMGDWILKKGIPAITKFAHWIGPKLSAGVTAIRGVVKTFTTTLSGNGETMKNLQKIGAALAAGFEKMKPVLRILAKVYLTELKVVWSGIALAIRTVIKVVTMQIEVFQKLAEKVEWVVDKIKAAWAKLPDFKISMPDLPNIPGFANGVRNFAGGLAVVGERGPELVRLPGGSDVVPNHRIGRGGGPSGQGRQVVTLEVKGDRAGAAALNALLRSVTVRYAD